MDQSTLTVLVIAFLSLLAISVTVTSIVILSGGKLYHKIPRFRQSIDCVGNTADALRDPPE
jgi:hypothetical protein